MVKKQNEEDIIKDFTERISDLNLGNIRFDINSNSLMKTLFNGIKKSLMEQIQDKLKKEYNITNPIKLNKYMTQIENTIDEAFYKVN